MGALPPNSMLQAVQKAIAFQQAFIARCGHVRRQHHATLEALRLAEALLENGFDLGRVRQAIEATAGGGDCSPLVPVTDQHIASPVPHAPDRNPEGSHEDANPLHDRTKSLRGQEYV